MLHPVLYSYLTQLHEGDEFEMDDATFVCGPNVFVSVATAFAKIKHSLRQGESVIEVAAGVFGFDDAWISHHVELVRHEYAETADH